MLRNVKLKYEYHIRYYQCVAKIKNIHDKNMIKNNTTLQGVFYQSEWVKINSSWAILVFQFMCVAANASELYCMDHLANIEHFLYHSKLSF